MIEGSTIENVVSATSLSKSYGDFPAVKEIDFTIAKGEIFGLIGPDGAGKTSIFHILGGVMDATAGEIEILGKKPRLARPDIGYLTQRFSLYLDLSIKENIRYTASLRHVSKEDLEVRGAELLELMDLKKFESRLAGNLSGGMKQKLALCCSLISRPKLLLLDEPTTGVDPVSRRDFWDVLSTIAAEGVTIAVATPYLDEAERCNRIALIYDGTIKQTGSPDELKDSLGLKRLEVRLDNEEALEEALSGLEFIEDVQTFGDRLDVLCVNIEKAKALVASKSTGKLTISEQRATLENVFVHTLRKDGSAETARKFEFKKNRSTHNGDKAIVADNLSKQFKDFYAVKKVSFDVGYGEIFGLLGANGAGKTTTIKMLCGLSSTTGGQMSICGKGEDLRNPNVRRRIGYMSQKFTLYDDLTVLENMEFYCGIYGIDPELRKTRINWALSNCGLDGNENLLTGKLPGGWKQRLAFGACVMHEPEVLFLDEPTSGVDPIARRQLWEMIRDFAKNGTAILVTTHFLEEAEHCQKLAFMVAGEIVAKGSPEEIKSEQPGDLIEFRTSAIQRSYLILRKHFGSWRISIFADKLHFVSLKKEDRKQVSTLLDEEGIQILTSRKVPYSLEDSFISIVHRTSKEVAV